MVDEIQQNSRAKNWCFTSFLTFCNRHSVHACHSDCLQWPDHTNERIGYICFQPERCPDTGRPHLQGFVQWHPKASRGWITGDKNPDSFWKSVHLSKCRGGVLDNYNYCSKSASAIGCFFEFGSKSIAGLGNVCKDIVLLITADKKKRYEIAADFPIEWARCSKAYELLYERGDMLEGNNIIAYSFDQLFFWQKKVVNYIKENTPLPKEKERKINWFVDQEGATGKTELVKHLIKEYGLEKVLVFPITDTARVVEAIYKIKSTIEMILIDLPRAYPLQHFNYDTLEMIQSGIAFRKMYHPCNFVFKIPHIFVFSNSAPDIMKFTNDRWNISYEFPKIDPTTFDHLF